MATTNMLERLSNTVWGLGVSSLRLSKRLRIAGPIERPLLWAGRHLIPAPSKPVEMVLPFGATFNLPPDFARARSYAVGTYEKDVTELLQSIIKPGMTVVDVGAFCGYYSLLASDLVGESGRVYAFEPHPVNFTYLLQNLEENGCANVITVNKALSDRDAVIKLVSDPEADHYWLQLHNSKDLAGVHVNTMTLDDFFRQEPSPRVDVMKMDIEGSEPAALAGMIEVSRANPQLKLIVEFDIGNLERCGFNRETFARLAEELGFTHGYVIERRLTPFSVRDSFPTEHGAYDLLLTKGPHNP